jgi:hypothetical protein
LISLQEVIEIMSKWLLEHLDKVRPDGEKIIPQAEPKK